MLPPDPLTTPRPPDRLRSLAVLATAATILGALALPLANGRVFHQDDLGSFHLPIRQHLATCHARGDDPRWFPALYCGYYLHGEGQAGIDHPWHRLLYAALPLDVAFNLELLASYPILYAGMALWLARLGLRRDAALFGALVFTFSGFNIVHYVHINAIAIIAHVPWLLIAIAATLDATEPRRAVRSALGVAVLTTSQVLLGYPQYVAFSLMVEASFAVWWSRGRGWRPLALLAGAKVVGLIGGGSQLIPTWEALALSVRSRPPRSFAATNSLHPLNLVQMVAPYLFRFRHFNGDTRATWPMHEYGLYNGAIVPALLAWLWIRRRSLGRFRPLAVAALWLGGAALILSFGRFTPVYPLWSRLPVIGLFRGPSRYVVLVHLAISTLVALAFADLVTVRPPIPRRALWPLAWPAIVSLLAGVILKLLAAGPCPKLAPELAAWGGVVNGPILVGLPALAILLTARGRRWAPLALIALTAADQVGYGVSLIYRHDPPARLEDLVKAGPMPPDRSVGYRVRIGGNQQVLGGGRLVDGYVALSPRRVLDYEKPAALRLAGVGLIYDDAIPGGRRRIDDPLPRARLVADARMSRDPKRDVERINLERSALVSEELQLPAGPPGSAEILDDRPGSIRIETRSESRRLLVLAESIHEGWRIAIDGKPGTINRVNGDFLGTLVEPGRHVVAFRFDPSSHRLGRLLSGAGLALMLAMAGFAVGAGSSRKIRYRRFSKMQDAPRSLSQDGISSRSG
jgi:hypothetical protein